MTDFQPNLQGMSLPEWDAANETIIIQKNAFHRSCPRCENPCEDQTSLEQSSGWHYLANRFACQSCNYTLETNLEEFSALALETDKTLCEVVKTNSFDAELLANNIAIRHLTMNGLNEYPLSKIESYVNKFDEKICETSLSMESAEFLPIYFLLAAIRFEDQCKPNQAEIAMECFSGYCNDCFEYCFEDILEIAGDEVFAIKVIERLEMFDQPYAQRTNTVWHHG